MISRAIQTVEPIFTKRIILEQDIINSEEKIKKILTLLPDDPLKEGLYKEWTIKRKMSAKDRWEQLTEELDRAATSFSSSRKPAGTSKGTLAAYKHLKHEIMLQYCYPRLDANVSIQLNHLLKSPFCVHPATDKVCVPFRPEEVDTFDPESVPKVRELLKEIYGDTFTGELLANHPIKYEETSMAEAMEIFDTFLKALQEEQKLCANFQRQDEDAKMVY